ncbi:hypothetical protein ACHAXT_011906 [Thalassiosira profunda]
MNVGGDGTVTLLRQQEQLTDIAKPHENDVLSGRGNFVNHHAGNEKFRKLVNHHKTAYVACPKAKKAIYAKIIYDEIRNMDPPGRYLKQDPKTKLWNTIGEKKAIDKTRQALREGAPELLKELESGGDGSGGVDSLAPLRTSQQQQMGLRGSMLSIGSFSVDPSFDMPGASFDAAGTGNSFAVPQHVGGGSNAPLFDSQGTQSLLAAAAQLQAQQQVQNFQARQRVQQEQPHNQQPQRVSSTAELEHQLHVLRQQMQTVQEDMQSSQQQGGGASSGSMGNNWPAPPEPARSSAQMGSNDMASLLAAIHNNSSGLNNAPGGTGENDATVQQQLAMMMMNRRMGDSAATLQTGNLASDMRQMNQRVSSTNGLYNSTGSTEDAFERNLTNVSNQMISIAEQQPEPSSFPQQFEDTSVPLKDRASPGAPSPNFNRRPARSGGAGLASSFTRAQRIGLKNSLTRRADLNNSLKNSLMSIESLTLDDIDGGAESFGTNVFDEVQQKVDGGLEKHGHPHDMSEISRMSEVSELDFQDT